MQILLNSAHLISQMAGKAGICYDETAASERWRGGPPYGGATRSGCSQSFLFLSR